MFQHSLFPGDDPLARTADLSACGDFRWTLGRRWADGPTLAWVMLNPSRADAERDDPTLLRVTKFSRRWGYGGLVVVNLYPYRSPSPAELSRWLARGDGVAAALARNAEVLSLALSECAGAVAAWGANGCPEAGRAALGGRRALCLGVTASGAPLHPLARGRMRVPDDVTPFAYAA